MSSKKESEEQIKRLLNPKRAEVSRYKPSVSLKETLELLEKAEHIIDTLANYGQPQEVFKDKWMEAKMQSLDWADEYLKKIWGIKG